MPSGLLSAEFAYLMPVMCSIIPLGPESPRPAGEFLRAVGAGLAEPADIVAVPVAAGGDVGADDALDALLAVPAAEIVASARMSGKAGQIVPAAVQVAGATLRVIFLGVGDRSAAALRRAGSELGRMLQPGERAVASAVAGQPPGLAAAFAEGILLGSYRFSEKSVAADQVPSAGQADVRLTGTAAAEAAIAQAALIVSAVGLARDLTNTPPLRKTPQWLADAAALAAESSSGEGASLTVRVWDGAELAAAGFGGITAVGSGSARPPTLIQMTYEPGQRGGPPVGHRHPVGPEGRPPGTPRHPAGPEGRPPGTPRHPAGPEGRPPGTPRHIVLVGKGITFDSGGLSLKPNDAMKAMKTDMAGGAAVIAAMSALASMGVTDKVTGLVAAAENLPSGSAYRPGDVLTIFGGRTVEVLNTDAEGRLVLADAISYANARLEPDLIVDLATLTGAARIALGSSRAALYSTSEQLAADLVAAGEASGDRLWRMPLTREYRQALDSPVADLANMPRQSPGAGSIMAALFLREFAGITPWAHLDIAGAARSGSDDGELSAGGTGFGVRLLLRWLLATAGQPAAADSVAA
jgi:leucyl aminopeptidase